VRLCTQREVDLVLMNGSRPLLGDAIPRGDVGAVLMRAPCDVAVLVEQRGSLVLDAEHPIVVPFGGADHDWAALELGAWLAHSSGAPLRLLGAAADAGERDASRLLGDASLVVQQLAGVTAEPLLVRPGGELTVAVQRSGVLVIGLSERWREEGLGHLRAAMARSAQGPAVFVRRGGRPGALAGPEDVTRFRWSIADGPPLAQ